jgi:hypothetical protein
VFGFLSALPKAGIGDMPQTIFGMSPVYNLNGMGEIQGCDALDPGSTIIDGTQMLTAVKPSP